MTSAIDHSRGITRARFLVISAGSIGKRHISNLRALYPESEIAVLRLHHRLDPGDLPKGSNLQFAHLADALAFKPDAAIIASPAPTHLDIALGLTAAHIPVLVEKPLHHTAAGVEQLVSLANANNTKVSVGYNLRFLPSLQRLKRALDEELIGPVHYVRAEIGQYLPDWRPGSDYRNGVTARSELGGGALLELSHEIDYLYWLFGMPDKITAAGGQLSDLEIDVEDCVDMLWTYQSSRRIISVHMDMTQRLATRNCKLCGKEGNLLWDAIAGTLQLQRPGEPPLWLSEPNEVHDRNDSYMAELQVFLGSEKSAALASSAPSAADGLDVLRLIDAAREAITNGMEQDL
ncbi:MAG: Gfo/Idh/MocA family oxidoreductase [Halioglobus sp.]